jgi:hypothetical protein
MIRQLCRFYSTKSFKDDVVKTIEKYIFPLINSDDINLLEYKDTKNNNAIHLFIKGKTQDKYSFVN